jgi:hypothetical protein
MAEEQEPVAPAEKPAAPKAAPKAQRVEIHNYPGLPDGFVDEIPESFLTALKYNDPGTYEQYEALMKSADPAAQAEVAKAKEEAAAAKAKAEEDEKLRQATAAVDDAQALAKTQEGGAK